MHRFIFLKAFNSIEFSPNRREWAAGRAHITDVSFLYKMCTYNEVVRFRSLFCVKLSCAELQNK